MSTRRTFLLSSAALALIPTLSRASRSGIGAEIVTDSYCSDGVLFANSFAMRSVNPGPDPLVFLQKLQDSMDGEKDARVFGLTSSSNRFLVEQTLAPLGFRRTYSGEHAYKDDRLCHTFTGTSPSLQQIASAVGEAGPQWAACLAGSFEQLISREIFSDRMTVQVAAQRPTDSTGYLCSWLLQRV